jgi:glycosyltransferase involved in cell wall biosynthesis
MERGAHATDSASREASGTISVVICAYTMERWDDLVRAVESVRRQTTPPLEIIIVVDGNEQLRARAELAFPALTVLPNAHGAGLSGGRGTGAAAARGAIVAFLDDDAIAEPGWLEELCRAYEDPDVLGAGGSVEPLWREPAPRWFPAEFNWVVGCSYAGMAHEDGRIRNPIGTNMSVRAEVLLRTGGFADELARLNRGSAMSGTAEETEFAIRAARLHPGGYWAYRPQARVRHVVPPHRATLGYFFDRCRVEGSAKAILSGLTGSDEGLRSERSYVRSTLPRAVARELASALRGRADGLAKAAVIVGGLAVTTLAYGRTRISRAFRIGALGNASERQGAE